jgi:hypothetical protein
MAADATKTDPAVPMVLDSPNRSLDMFDESKMNMAMKVAEAISLSGAIPDTYKGKKNDVFVALIKSSELHVSLFSLMEKSYMVHGKIGYEATFVIALINNSGMFEEELDWKIEPDGCTDPAKMSVTCFAKSKKSGKVLTSPAVTMSYVHAMGWDSNKQWVSNFIMMARYRTASMLARLYCPQVVMGLQTVDEIRDADFTVIDDGGQQPAKSLFGAAPAPAASPVQPTAAMEPKKAKKTEKAQEQAPAERDLQAEQPSKAAAVPQEEAAAQESLPIEPPAEAAPAAPKAPDKARIDVLREKLLGKLGGVLPMAEKYWAEVTHHLTAGQTINDLSEEALDNLVKQYPIWSSKFVQWKNRQ